MSFFSPVIRVPRVCQGVRFGSSQSFITCFLRKSNKGVSTTVSRSPLRLDRKLARQYLHLGTLEQSITSDQVLPSGCSCYPAFVCLNLSIHVHGSAGCLFSNASLRQIHHSGTQSVLCTLFLLYRSSIITVIGPVLSRGHCTPARQRRSFICAPFA